MRFAHRPTAFGWINTAPEPGADQEKG